MFIEMCIVLPVHLWAEQRADINGVGASAQKYTLKIESSAKQNQRQNKKKLAPKIKWRPREANSSAKIFERNRQFAK